MARVSKPAIVTLVMGLLLAAAAAAAVRHHRPSVDFNHNAVIFVHGFEGSGAQFESQKMRLTSNGYPDRYVVTFEYDSLLFASGISGGSITAQEQALFPRLDRLIAHMKK